MAWHDDQLKTSESAGSGGGRAAARPDGPGSSRPRAAAALGRRHRRLNLKHLRGRAMIHCQSVPVSTNLKDGHGSTVGSRRGQVGPPGPGPGPSGPAQPGRLGATRARAHWPGYEPGDAGESPAEPPGRARRARSLTGMPASQSRCTVARPTGRGGSESLAALQSFSPSVTRPCESELDFGPGPAVGARARGVCGLCWGWVGGYKCVHA
jgi:hypothetical protein